MRDVLTNRPAVRVPSCCSVWVSLPPGLDAAQVSCAGAFIGSHLPSGWTERGGGWLHVDCAAPAEGGTGYGVALLVELLRSYREGQD